MGVMVWIGLNHLSQHGGWQWSDGSPLALVNHTSGIAGLRFLVEELFFMSSINYEMPYSLFIHLSRSDLHASAAEPAVWGV